MTKVIIVISPSARVACGGPGSRHGTVIREWVVPLPDREHAAGGGGRRRNDDELRHDLLARIEARRSAVTQFLQQNRPSVRRWSTVTITLSSLAAVFTAGPAIGGENFAGGVQNLLGLSSDSSVWRTLCLLALLVSVGAAVMTNLAKPHEAAVNRLTRAEAAKAELEGLETLLQFGHLSLEDGAKLFHEYSTKIPFVDDVPAVSGGGTRAWPAA